MAQRAGVHFDPRHLSRRMADKWRAVAAERFQLVLGKETTIGQHDV
jgi:hypothetical protein